LLISGVTATCQAQPVLVHLFEQHCTLKAQGCPEDLQKHTSGLFEQRKFVQHRLSVVPGVPQSFPLTQQLVPFFFFFFAAVALPRPVIAATDAASPPAAMPKRRRVQASKPDPSMGASSRR
jgi:hypothetical protein